MQAEDPWMVSFGNRQKEIASHVQQTFPLYLKTAMIFNLQQLRNRIKTSRRPSPLAYVVAET